MPAERKLLLADDSPTIQKVVELTFADEGIAVTAVSNGREAINAIEAIGPDIVLADVVMPEINGYEVCEYVKKNDRLKHIPVILLVGSFEPLDDTEARRVGADDILTKPFQSIRRLVDRVGILMAVGPKDHQPAEEAIEDKVETAELPPPEPPEIEKLTTEEIERTTADTQPLPDELKHLTEAHTSEISNLRRTNYKEMETSANESSPETSQPQQAGGDVVLDLGVIDQPPSAGDFELDIDLDEPLEIAVEAEESEFVYTRRQPEAAPEFEEPAIESSVVSFQPPIVSSVFSPVVEEIERTSDPGATTQEWIRVSDDEPEESGSQTKPLTKATQPVASLPPGASVSSELSPEMIDAIARRAVERLSQEVVEQIAWEVVPPLAELLIKQQLEKESQSK